MSTDNKGHYPTALDKWLLVFYKKYPSKAEIPQTISSHTMRRVHDRARVHVSLGMMFLASVGMLVNVIIGKRRAASGVTIENIANDYQLQYNKRKEDELKNKP